MGERKVLNFYVSPDFDATIIPKGFMKRDKNKGVEVRTMLPYSMRCNMCGEYMYRGKKVNSRKENMPGEEYMGIMRFRFYFKCNVCSAEITFCTDPKNSDYSMESGASRNFEVWRDNDAEVAAAEAQRKEEDRVDAMKALENRTLDSKTEMDVLDALDEIQAINQRHERVDTNAVIDKFMDRNIAADDAAEKEAAELTRAPVLLSTGLTIADEELIRSIKFKQKGINIPLPDSDSDEEKHKKNTKNIKIKSETDNIMTQIQNQRPTEIKAVPQIVRKKITKIENNIKDGNDRKISNNSGSVLDDGKNKKQKIESMDPQITTVMPQTNGLGGLMAYGSDDSD
jgi:hypothetical protein